MTEDFIHLLVTRWNIKLSPPRTCNAEWMKHRIELFKRFCLPSVREQTTKKFHWLLLIDKSTTGEYEKRISELVSPCDFPVKVLRSQTIKEYANSRKEKWLIASRLDNDDILAASYMEKMQERFRGREKLIRAKLGYQMKIDKRFLPVPVNPEEEDLTLFLSGSRSGPFLSIHSKRESGVLMDGDHTSINKRVSGRSPSALIPGVDFPIEYLLEPMWIQTIHGKNAGNSFPPKIHMRPKNIVPITKIKGFSDSEKWSSNESSC